MFKVNPAIKTNEGLELNLSLPNPVRTEISKKMHDINAALRTMQFCTEALQNGYKFDDDMAAAKVDAMARASATLKQETEILLQAYKGCADALTT